MAQQQSSYTLLVAQAVGISDSGAPRIKITTTLNNRVCNFEFALVDLDDVFKGLEDKAGVRLLLPA